MLRTMRFCLLPLSVVLLLAGGDSFWRNKQVSQWNEEDAKQVLAGSPWVKKATVAVIPQRSEAQLRDGGKMGGGKGAGLDALDASLLTGIGGSRRSGKAGSDFSKNHTLMVRWESALPVRIAELKASEAGAPDWDGEYYVIAVYDVPGLFDADQRTLPSDLRRVAVLQREGRKDLNPERVDVVLSADKLARVVYLFPRSAGITAEDKRLGLVAQIGRLSLAQYFFTEEMRLQGKLEL